MNHEGGSINAESSGNVVRQDVRLKKIVLRLL